MWIFSAIKNYRFGEQRIKHTKQVSKRSFSSSTQHYVIMSNHSNIVTTFIYDFCLLTQRATKKKAIIISNVHENVSLIMISLRMLPAARNLMKCFWLNIDVFLVVFDTDISRIVSLETVTVQRMRIAEHSHHSIEECWPRTTLLLIC